MTKVALYHAYKIILICLSIFLFFLLLNLCQPLFMDDFGRANIDALYNQTILANLYSDYFYWTGRLSAQTPVYMFFNKSYPSLIYLFDFINALAITSLFVYLYIAVVRDNESILSKKFLIFFTLVLVYFTMSGFIKNAVWKTAGIQYLWGLSIYKAKTIKVDKRSFRCIYRYV